MKNTGKRSARRPRGHQIDDLKKVASAYALAAGISIATVSSHATGDGAKLTSVLERDADMTTRRFDTTMWWFADNWPEGAPWPAGVARP